MNIGLNAALYSEKTEASHENDISDKFSKCDCHATVTSMQLSLGLYFQQTCWIFQQVECFCSL